MEQEHEVADEIQLFVKRNLERPYFEKAEDLFILKPIYGLLIKWIEYKEKRNKQKDNEIESLKEKITRLDATIDYKDVKIRELNSEIKRLKEMINGNFKINGSRLTLIGNIINDYFKVDIRSKKRFANVVYARQMAMYFARLLTQESERKIGFEFADRDHSTVYHAVKKINNLSIYPGTKKDIKELTDIIISAK